MAIWGRKVSTPPTPVIMPSHTRLTSQGIAPAVSIAPRTYGENISSTNRLTISDSHAPTVPKVRANMHSIMPMNMGSAHILWVSTRSILSEAVASPGFCPRLRAIEHTLVTYLYLASAIMLSLSPRGTEAEYSATTLSTCRCISSGRFSSRRVSISPSISFISAQCRGRPAFSAYSSTRSPMR